MTKNTDQSVNLSTLYMQAAINIFIYNCIPFNIFSFYFCIMYALIVYFFIKKIIKLVCFPFIFLKYIFKHSNNIFYSSKYLKIISRKSIKISRHSISSKRSLCRSVERLGSDNFYTIFFLNDVGPNLWSGLGIKW